MKPTIQVPTDWSDVTLRQFKEIADVPSLGFSEIDSKLRVLSILTGKDDSLFFAMPMTKLSEFFTATRFVYQEPKMLKLKARIKVKGKSFHINNLPSQLVAGEYIDLTDLLKKDSNSNLEKIVAIFLKPVNILGRRKKRCYEKVDGRMWIQTLESRRKTEKLILDNLTMDKVFPLTGFFLKLWEGLTKATKDYSETELTKAMSKLQKEADLVKSTDGTLQLTN